MEVLWLMSLTLMNHPVVGQGRDPPGACRDSSPGASGAACLPSTGEQEVQSTGSVAPASTETLNSILVPSSLLHRCTWRSNSTCVAPSSPALGWHFFLSCCPMQPLCVFTLSQIISFSSVSTAPPPTISHFILCRTG